MPGEDNKNNASNTVQNDAIRSAIDLFDIPQARLLLRDALRTADAETYYLASLVALSDRQKRDFLQKAIATDPFHVEAFAALEKLTNPTEPGPATLPIETLLLVTPLAAPLPDEPSFLQQTTFTPQGVSESPYEPKALTSTAAEAKPAVVASTPGSSTTSDAPIAHNFTIMPDSMPTEPTDVSPFAREAVTAGASADASESRNPTPPGGIAIQQLVPSAVSISPQSSETDKDYVKGIVKQDTPLYVIPDRRGTIRAQLLAFAEVILLARTDDSRWVNVIWLSSINKESLGWLPLSTISNGYVQGNSVNLIDLPITQFEFSDPACLVELQVLLQWDKWDQLRRGLNLITIIFGIAFCSFFVIDAAAGIHLSIDYLSIAGGGALILFGLIRWWIGTAVIRQKWHILAAIRRRKEAAEDSAIALQANNAALKLASEMVISLLRARSEHS